MSVHPLRVSSNQSDGWMDVTLNPIEGDPQAKALFLTQTGSDDRSHLAGIVTMQPCVLRSEVGVDESLLVLEGEARLEFDSGEVIEIGPGDMLFMPMGTKLKMHVLSPFREMFFGTNYEPLGDVLRKYQPKAGDAPVRQ